MKYFATALFCLSAVMAISQTNTPEPIKDIPRSFIKLSPFQFFSQTLELSIETLNPTYTKAFQISGSYRSGHNDYVDGKGGSLTLAFRKYVRPLSVSNYNSDVVQGIYYSLLVKGEIFEGTNTYWGNTYPSNVKERITSIGPAFTLGLQRNFFDVIYADFYVGGGIKFPSTNYTPATSPGQVYHEDNDILHPAYEGIYPVIGIKVGVSL